MENQGNIYVRIQFSKSKDILSPSICTIWYHLKFHEKHLAFAITINNNPSCSIASIYLWLNELRIFKNWSKGIKVIVIDLGCTLVPVYH